MIATEFERAVCVCVCMCVCVCACACACFKEEWKERGERLV